MAHQARGVAWLIENPKGMLAWQMRCGKTATALRAWENTQEYGPALILCPATGRENWRREALRFAIDADLRPNVQILSNNSEPINPASDIVITNYDKLLQPNIVKRLRGRGRWGALILDEAHALKTPGAKRTQLVYGGGHHKQTPLIDFSERVWPLTGTPMLNHPGELWTHAYHLWPETIVYREGRPMEQWEFELGFCEIRHTDYGPKICGGKNLAELKARLDPKINRLKLNEVIDMPPVRCDTWPLDMEKTSGVGVFPDIPALCQELSQKYGRAQEIDTFDNGTVDVYLACIQANATNYAEMRRETGTLKAIATGLLVHDELSAGGEKTVVFAYHREALAVLSRALAEFEPAVIHGGVPAGKRQEEIDRFWNDPKCRVFLGNRAASEIIDLSISNNVVFAEADWVHGVNEQAMFRVLGPKQTKPVLVRFAYLKGSIDELVNRANARKAAIVSQVIN